MKPKDHTPGLRNSSIGVPLVTAIVVSFGLSAANAQNWIGGTSTDWNDASNWSGGVLPNGVNAIINNGGSGNIATISTNTTSTHNDIDVRNGSRLDHTAGTTGTGGSSWMFVGQDSTAGTYNLANTASTGVGITGFAQGSGSLNANGNLLIGGFGSNRTGTVRINTSGTLAVAGETYVDDNTGSVGNFFLESGTVTMNNKIFIGNSNGTGTLTMSGGTITKTGGEKFIVGHNNGVGTVVQSGGTITANNELYIGNENASASGTYTLSGSGALNVDNEVVVGREGGTGVLNVNGGNLTTTGNGNTYIGRRNGNGTLNQTAGTISVNREFGVGSRDGDKIGTGTYNLSGGSITVTQNFFVGKEQGAIGTMTMTGGTVNANESLRIGHNQATGTLTHSAGTINVQNEVYIGNENSASSVGNYTLSGSAEFNVGNEVHIGRDAPRTDWREDAPATAIGPERSHRGALDLCLGGDEGVPGGGADGERDLPRFRGDAKPAITVLCSWPQ